MPACLEYVSGTSAQTVQFKPPKTGTKQQALESGQARKETDLSVQSAESSKLLTHPGLLRVPCGGQQENREWGHYPSHALIRSKVGVRETQEGCQHQKLRTYQGCC